MSQLVVRPGRNAARQAKKLKEIRKVQGAIVWHERERKKRQKLYQERWESKQAVLQRVKWDNENFKAVRKKALRNAKEDWQLGPLRPNRAIGEDAEKYGALTAAQMQKPDIPVHTQRNRNEAREKRGLEPEYPLVVDDKKYFHIEKDDRVVVVNGREKGKIGVVQDVIARTHEIIVKGVNMQYYDSDVFNSTEDIGPRRENEVPIPISDVRLVVPYEMTQIVRSFNKATGMEEEKSVKVYKDVVVEKVTMHRHTTGIDPFTGTDHGPNEFPKDHQYDPTTGLPIFHRYIAGTQHRIEWPWERADDIEDSGVTPEDKSDRQSFLRRTLGTLRHPITSLKRMTSKQPEPAAADDKIPITTKLEEARHKAERKFTPKSKDPRHAEAFDNIDTTRNIVEGADSMAYTLIAPPFPDTLGEELRSDITSFETEARKDKDAPRPVKVKRSTEQGAVASEIAKAKHTAAQKMKTPMQLRWETEHSKKVKMQKKEPLVSTDELLKALGRHIQAQRKPRVEKAKVDGVD